MKRLTFVCAALALFATTWAASPPAEAAKSWGLPGEEIARFEATAVDVLCVLTGDCPEDCGAGKRVMGLLKDDGELVLAIKNGGPFTGAAHELTPYCGQQVVADGLFTINYGVKSFALQFIMPVGGEWRRANDFVRDWANKRGLDMKDKKVRQWFRNGEQINAIIEEQGKLGLKKEGITP